LVPQQDRVFIVPGAHPALTGILGLLAKPGDVVLVMSNGAFGGFIPTLLEGLRGRFE
jgi:aspartate aminotransferase-like enzyme